MIIERPTKAGEVRYQVRVNNKSHGTYGNPLDARKAEREAKHRFISQHPEQAYRVDEDTGCWVWTSTLHSGYGRLHVRHKHVLAHRFMYERQFGPIPEGMQLDHLCRNKACVNPAHLEPVSASENMKRARAARRYDTARTSERKSA